VGRSIGKIEIDDGRKIMISLLVSAVAMSGQPILALTGLDPIDLIHGKELAGDKSYSSSFGRHQYQFCSEAHLKQFENEPLKYAVQNGGACGKMGAMTGQGSPDRWLVANGMIFLFASDGCRDTFKSRVDEYFKPIEKPPLTTETELSRAADAFKKMIAAHGGESALSKLRNVEWTYEIPYKENGVSKIWLTKGAILDKERYALWEQWDSGKSFFVTDRNRSVEGSLKGTFSIHPGELREFTATVARNPIAVLMGMATPLKGSEDRKSIVMSYQDIAFTVELDKASRIARIRFVDKYAGPVSSVVVEYSDYVDVEGVALPKTRRVKVNDGLWGKTSTITAITAGKPEPDVFVEAFKV
jgi:YHS domain-containing protein